MKVYTILLHVNIKFLHRNNDFVLLYLIFTQQSNSTHILPVCIVVRKLENIL